MDEGMGVMAAMQKLKKAIVGFYYEISIHPETNRLNGVFWSFPEQRWDLSHYGMLLFVDGTHGTTHHDWPLFTPCVLDSFNRLRAVGYCLVDSECGPAQSWMLQCMVRAEPLWKAHVIFNDSKLAEDSITLVFPEAKIFLCWWHIVHRCFVYDIFKFYLHFSLLKV
jgi:hypothetical protein